MDKAGYMKGREDSEDLFVTCRCYLLDLETLGYDILMRDHNLVAVISQVSCYDPTISGVTSTYSFGQSCGSTTKT